MLKTLFGNMPREFGAKRTFIKDIDSFYSIIDKFNGKINCYTTVYSVPQPRAYNDIKHIDKIYLDFDNPKNCWNTVKRLHKELEYKHCVLFTGGGFAVFIFCEEKELGYTKELKYPKNAIANAQRWIADRHRLVIGKSKDADIDEHVIGDIARITRVPYTFNIKPTRRRFCIPLIENDFQNLDYEGIKQLATQQRFVNPEQCIFNPDEPFSMSTFDTEPLDVDLKMPNDYKIELNGESDKMIEQLPPLIKYLLKTTKCGWRDRYLTILAMRESGWPVSLAATVCQKYWTPEKFRHAMHDERQFEYIYSRCDLFYPNWQTLEREGYYVSKEDKEFKFYGSNK